MFEEAEQLCSPNVPTFQPEPFEIAFSFFIYSSSSDFSPILYLLIFYAAIYYIS